MNKSNYIKVTSKEGKSSVVLASNKSFYESQDYKISEPSQEEINTNFPSGHKSTGSVVNIDTSATDKALEKMQNALKEEKAEHVKTNKLLTEEQKGHKKTKETYDNLLSEHEKIQNALQEAASNINKLETEIANLKSGK